MHERRPPPSVALTAEPHRRYNPLSGQWVLVSPQRMERPWQGQVEPRTDDARSAYDPACYLCPGNARANGDRNPRYDGAYLFDNDFAALTTLSPAATSATLSPPPIGASDLLVAVPESGVCRVVCFSPRHDLSLPDMTVPAILGVVDLWAEEYLRLGSRDDIGHVQIFENKGPMMGCSNPHPHGQIWAQRSLPHESARELDALRAHHDRHGRTLLADYLTLELARDERIVCANDGFVALVPFWAVWPFETLIVSRRPVPHLGALTDAERRQLADILRRLTTRYDNLFETSFPYSAGVHQAPTDGASHPEAHLHLHFHPPLLRSATIRKFLVGYEMLGEPQRDLTAEMAAARLRAESEVLYRAARP